MGDATGRDLLITRDALLVESPFHVIFKDNIITKEHLPIYSTGKSHIITLHFHEVTFKFCFEVVK